MKCYGLVMAGGGGTRFWPLSRREKPKQLLNLTGRETMINETIGRLKGLVPAENIWIVTAENQGRQTAETVGSLLPEGHILYEPASRNTAACIGYSAEYLLRTRGDGVMAVTPSDAYVRDEPAFCRALETAVRTAEETDCLVTVGIPPTRPETGYGYIQHEKTGEGIHRVISFREKPDLKTAEEYLRQENCLWNSGIMIGRISVIIRCFRQFAPDIAEQIDRIGEAFGTERENPVFREIYPQIRSISVDYAILEPAAAAGQVMVVRGDFGWSDIGSWDRMDALHSPDRDGNVLAGDVTVVDSRENVVYSSGRKIAMLGVDHLVVVETPDAVLICRREQAQEVRRLVDALEEEGRTDIL